MRLRLLVALVLATAAPSGAQTLTVAAASDLQSVMPAIVSAFEGATGRSVRVAFGSSGNFFAQIQNGAPFDLFFSADIDYPQRLERAGLATPGSLHEYATGRLVLWAPRNSRIDLSRGLPSLLAPQVRRIAIANPAHAPYGRAAVEALRQAGLYDQLRAKFVIGENVSQAAQFVESGNADVGILARSITLLPALEGGASQPLPPDAHPAIVQAAIIVKASRNQDLARSFLAFFRTDATTALLKRFGFDAPAAQGR